MSDVVDLPTEQRLRHLLSHLGLREAHFAGRLVRDWIGLVTGAPDIVTSLTLVGSSVPAPDVIAPIASRLLVLSGDRGPVPERWRAVTGAFPTARLVQFPDYTIMG
jgi:hypothetical protein